MGKKTHAAITVKAPRRKLPIGEEEKDKQNSKAMNHYIYSRSLKRHKQEVQYMLGIEVICKYKIFALGYAVKHILDTRIKKVHAAQKIN